MSGATEAATGAVASVRVGLISDTHGKLRAEVFSVFENVDAIVHAGDIGDNDIITELEAIAPVYAVHGNTDSMEVAPAEQRVRLGERIIVVAHGHLLGAPTPSNLRARYPDCDVIVYGHTHKPLVDDAARPLVVNPGAAGPARFNLRPSVAILDVATLKVDYFGL